LVARSSRDCRRIPSYRRGCGLFDGVAFGFSSEGIHDSTIALVNAGEIPRGPVGALFVNRNG